MRKFWSMSLVELGRTPLEGGFCVQPQLAEVRLAKSASAIPSIASHGSIVSNIGSRRAPCEGGAFQWVKAPSGQLAPAGSNRSGHGGNEMAEAFG